MDFMTETARFALATHKNGEHAQFQEDEGS